MLKNYSLTIHRITRRKGGPILDTELKVTLPYLVKVDLFGLGHNGMLRAAALDRSRHPSFKGRGPAMSLEIVLDRFRRHESCNINYLETAELQAGRAGPSCIESCSPDIRVYDPYWMGRNVRQCKRPACVVVPKRTNQCF